MEKFRVCWHPFLIKRQSYLPLSLSVCLSSLPIPIVLMFQWAQSTFDKLSQTVAPPPTDGPGKFAYCVQRNDEAGAMGVIAEIDPVHTVVNAAKGIYPIHMACEYSMIRLVRLLLSQPGANIQVEDFVGNTPMHYAALSTNNDGLELCKILVKEFGASVMAKNRNGQTPYDLATSNNIRQYLLPIQLQAETQYALDNGGVGLPPGIDLGGLRVKNLAMPPPPTQFGAPPNSAPPSMYVAPPTLSGATPNIQPLQSFQPQQNDPMANTQAASPYVSLPVPEPQNDTMFGTPTPNHKIAPAPASMPAHLAQAPSSGNREYARVGSSSAAIYRPPGGIRPDGFHSSSSDVNLQKKYGHQQVQYGNAVPPPPSSGNSTGLAAPGMNPFAAGSALGGGSRYGSLPPPNRRYVAYGPTTPAPAPASLPTYNPYAAPAMPPNVTMFTPGAAAVQQFTPSPMTQQQTQTAYGTEQIQPQYAQPQQPQSEQYQAQQFQSPYAQAPLQAQQEPSSTPPNLSSPYLPPPPYQMQNNSQPPAAVSQFGSGPAGFVSPAAATYGSASTPTASIGSPASTFGTPAPTEAVSIFSSPPSGGLASPSNTSSHATMFSTPSPKPVPTQPSVAKVAAVSADSSSPMDSMPPKQAVVREKSAEELFSEEPPMSNNAKQNYQLSEPSVRSATEPTTEVPSAVVPLERTKSAEEIFFEQAPSDPVAGTSSLTGSSSEQGAFAQEKSPVAPSNSNTPQQQHSEVPMSEQGSEVLHEMPLERTKSAEELFFEQPPLESVNGVASLSGTNTPQGVYLLETGTGPLQSSSSPPAENQSLASEHFGTEQRSEPCYEISLERAKSAEEIFSEQPPKETASHGTPSGTSSAQCVQDTERSAEQLFASFSLRGANEPQISREQPVAVEVADFFASGPMHVLSGSPMPASGFGNHGPLSGSPPPQQIPSQSLATSRVQNSAESNQEKGGNSPCGEEEEEMMTDVPLDENYSASLETAVNFNQTVSTQAAQAPAPATSHVAENSAESLFAAIGMPPPPFSKEL